jgi:hypothetical protein
MMLKKSWSDHTLRALTEHAHRYKEQPAGTQWFQRASLPAKMKLHF